jgi:hypothetical protein
MSGGTNAVARAIRLRAGFSSRMGMAAVVAKLSFSLKSLGASDKEVLWQRCENEDNSQ